MKKILSLRVSLFLVIAFFVCENYSFALDQIIRPYQGVRTSGMGGVRLTTGLYDENFFGNPARVVSNPSFRMTIFDLMTEFNGNSIQTTKDLLSGGDVLQKIGDTAGKNNHGRVQTTFPFSFYLPAKGDRKMSYAFGIISSAQFDVDLRRSFNISPQALFDFGPAFTIGRRYLKDDVLAVGLTPHITYRLASEKNYSFVDLIKGLSLSPSHSGGDGAMLDIDIGGTYDLPFTWKEFKFISGAAINNFLGGNYSNLGLSMLNTGNKPTPQPRSLGFGMSANRPTLWRFKDVVFALEFTDIGNNPDGGMFRTVHLGGEARYGVWAPRLGINQGYFTAGLGVDVRYFTFDFATYGEELSLNPGLLGDRRYAFRISLGI
ncbi:MAG: hypothetical protein AABZ06_05030 [Bdellovibrionota bacterium]